MFFRISVTRSMEWYSVYSLQNIRFVQFKNFWSITSPNLLIFYTFAQHLYRNYLVQRLDKEKMFFWHAIIEYNFTWNVSLLTSLELGRSLSMQKKTIKFSSKKALKKRWKTSKLHSQNTIMVWQFMIQIIVRDKIQN